MQRREIEEQLGESSPEQEEVLELRRRMDEAELPELPHKEVEKELVRLERMSAQSPDYQTTRSYVDLVLDLPWTKTTEDNLDLSRAREILDEDHFDLKEIKDRIRKSAAHIHVPAGATPKDGPSAGVTMATALASAFAEVVVREERE